MTEAVYSQRWKKDVIVNPWVGDFKHEVRLRFPARHLVGLHLPRFFTLLFTCCTFSSCLSICTSYKRHWCLFSRSEYLFWALFILCVLGCCEHLCAVSTATVSHRGRSTFVSLEQSCSDFWSIEFAWSNNNRELRVKAGKL